jgi:hypothetical protein
LILLLPPFYITKYHKNIFYFHARLLKITFILPHNIGLDFYFNVLLTNASYKTYFHNTTPYYIYLSLITLNFILLLFNQDCAKSLLFEHTSSKILFHDMPETYLDFYLPHDNRSDIVVARSDAYQYMVWPANAKITHFPAPFPVISP